MAAGKSTLVAQPGRETGAVLMAEDTLTATLWPRELVSLESCRDHSARLAEAMWPHLAGVLAAGVSIVMDFPANTRGQRARLRRLSEMSGAAAVFHFLDVPDEVCLERLAARNAAGTHAYTPTEADFHRFTAFFEPPAEAEGLETRRVAAS